MQPRRRLPEILTRPWARLSVAALLFVLLANLVPRWWCARDAQRWYEGDPDLALAHAREIVATIGQGVAPADEAARSDPAIHEWESGIYQTSAVALLQLCLERPGLRDELLPAAERCIDELTSPRIRELTTKKWGTDPLDTLESDGRGHAAYLGGLNLVLSLHRRVEPGSRFAELNDRISASLVRRLRASRHGILETSPGRACPADNAAVLGSLLLHARATGSAPPDAAATMQARFRLAWRHPASGLLYPAIDPVEGRPAGAPRASDTARAALLVSHGDRALARELYQSTRDRCADSLLGFAYIAEYPIASEPAGPGDDGDSLLFGVSPAATVHALAAARMFGERRQFVALYRTAHLLGAPVSRDGRRVFAAAGPLGNARLLAMLTARPEVP